VAYASRAWNSTQNDMLKLKEALAIVVGYQIFHDLMFGRHFVVEVITNP